MVEIETIKSVLRGLRREITPLDGVGYAVKMRDQNYVLKTEDIEFYLLHKPQIKRATETQIFFPGYYEHVIQFEGASFRRPYRRDENALELQSADSKTKIEISRPSALFCLCLTDVDEMDRELRRLATFIGPPRGAEDRSISDLIRLYTIKVVTGAEGALGSNRNRLHDLAEASIFHFAYGQGVSISFTKSWIRTNYWLGRKESETVQFPLRTYNSELVSYYNLALASESLVLAYLAFYKILEFFFTSVSENALHARVTEQLVAPDFAHTKAKKLRELIKTVRNFDMRFDEFESLKLVLSTYFEKLDLRSWIENYEDKNGNYFTESVTVFGSNFRIDTSDSTLIPNIANRIYAIRNALVHNKEGEISRFIPYTGQEETLLKEVQILQHIAEQLIIKTGKDFTTS